MSYWCRWDATSSGMQLIAYGMAFYLDFGWNWIMLLNQIIWRSFGWPQMRSVDWFIDSIWRWTQEPANPPTTAQDRPVRRLMTVQRRNSLWAWYWGRDLHKAVHIKSDSWWTESIKTALRKLFAMGQALACNSENDIIACAARTNGLHQLHSTENLIVDARIFILAISWC